MAKPPIERDQSNQITPDVFAQVTPRDLHPTSDIRFVMIELGKLTANVERLITDVASHGAKIDAMRHQVSFVKGAIWIASGVLGLAVLLAGWYVQGRITELLDAIAKLAK